MATTTTARRAPRTSPRPAPLRVVRPDERARTVGAIGTIVAGFLFVVLLSLAGLHAIVVQTQAQLDAVNADIAALEDARVNAIAQRAWFDSPAGLAESATEAGLVPAADFEPLAPVAPGLLGPPEVADPFEASGGGAG